MISYPNMGLINLHFSEKIMFKHGDLSLSNSDFITKLFKKLHSYSHRSPDLIYALPFILKRSVLNKYLKMISSKSTSNILSHNIPINLNLNLPLSGEKNVFDVSLTKNTQNIQKGQFFINELFSPNFSLLFTTYLTKLLDIQKSGKHRELGFLNFNKVFKTICNGKRPIFATNILTRFDQMGRDERQINRHFLEIEDAFTPYIKNSFFATNLILNKYNAFKDNKKLFDNDYIDNYVSNREFDDYNPKISHKSLFYNYPEIAHLKTSQKEVVKEKTMGKELDSEFTVSETSLSNIDVNKMADQVYSIIERRIKIERERRGLSA